MRSLHRGMHRGMHRGLQLVCTVMHRVHIGYVSGYTWLISNWAHLLLGSFLIGLNSRILNAFLPKELSN